MAADRAIATAPASVGNVAVGFDILGHSLAGPVDRVIATRTGAAGVRITAIAGVDGAAALPLAAQANTAGRAVLSLLAAHAPDLGAELRIDKGIPLSAGMGGSAASAVAALVAVNALLPAPLPVVDLYPFALDGEAVASGARHGDNLGPQLLGGLVLSTATDLIAIPAPADLYCALAHPDQRLETRRAREVLREPFPLADVVAQGESLALVLLGVQRGDYGLIGRGLRDRLVEPRRAPLIPGFAEVQRAAREAGALGCSISGAGPSLFAWCRGADAAHAVADAMRAAFAAAGSACETWVSPVAGPAARLESVQ
jgi:homoserine kinase